MRDSDNQFVNKERIDSLVDECKRQCASSIGRLHTLLLQLQHAEHCAQVGIATAESERAALERENRELRAATVTIGLRLARYISGEEKP